MPKICLAGLKRCYCNSNFDLDFKGRWVSTAHRCFLIRCHVFQQLCSKPPKNLTLFCGGGVTVTWMPVGTTVMSTAVQIQMFTILSDRYISRFQTHFGFLRSKIFMATHIMLSFSTQIAQHTEEHPPTPWRVGPCNQVTGAQGRGGGKGEGGYLQQGVAAMPKYSKICRSSA